MTGPVVTESTMHSPRDAGRAAKPAELPRGRRALAGRIPAVFGLAALFALGAGCASLPENAVAERLDERTGTTVTAMQRPVELVSTEPRGSNSDPFAYVAPFETNRMGARQLYLWVAAPDERGGAGVPVVLLGNEPLALRPLGTDPRAAGLASFPYAAPAPWSAQQVYQIDEAALRSLAAAASIDITVRYADARVVRFSGAPRPAEIVGEFLRSLGL
jgi:hypothetical protein